MRERGGEEGIYSGDDYQLCEVNRTVCHLSSQVATEARERRRRIRAMAEAEAEGIELHQGAPTNRLRLRALSYTGSSYQQTEAEGTELYKELLPTDQM